MSKVLSLRHLDVGYVIIGKKARMHAHLFLDVYAGISKVLSRCKILQSVGRQIRGWYSVPGVGCLKRRPS